MNKTYRTKIPDGVVSAFSAICVVVLCAGGAHAQTSRPAVPVVFENQSGLFTDLPAADIQVTAERVAEKICDIAERRWGFLEWCPAAANVNPGGRWLVRLESEAKTQTLPDGDTITNFIVHLRHYAEVGGSEFKIYQTESAETLYDFGALRQDQSADKLRDDILDKLDEQIQTLVRGSTVRTAVGRIPVAQELILDADNQQIIVPLRLREDLRAEGEVVLRIAIKDAGSIGPGFKLEEAGGVENGERQGFIIGKVIDWDIHPLTPPIPTWWVEQLPDLLDQAEGVVVFMFDYSPSLSGLAGVDDGIILDPDI